jgi:hypothetical protein
VRYELGFYITGEGIFHSHCGENLKSYTVTIPSTTARASVTICSFYVRYNNSRTEILLMVFIGATQMCGYFYLRVLIFCSVVMICILVINQSNQQFSLITVIIHCNTAPYLSACSCRLSTAYSVFKVKVQGKILIALSALSLNFN